MPTLEQLAAETDLHPDDIRQIHRLFVWWQLIADLSFADLAIWAPMSEMHRFVCLGQMRPYTTQTLYTEDLFGQEVTPDEDPVLERAFREGRTWQRDDPLLIDGVLVRKEAIPIPHRGRVMAVMTKEGAPLTHRRPGRLEENYLECAAALTLMVAEGTFPFEGDPHEPEIFPRVGDGMARVDPGGRITYASPNAVSALRRLGIVYTQGAPLEELQPTSAALEALERGLPAESDVEIGGTVVLQRAIPFLEGPHREVKGAIMLIRDVTELRHRERMLQRKEAVIQEIHHRVKNNLQTIASLLRIQTRRLQSAEAKRELEEAVRRIASIAMVHETLSQDSSETVEFSSVARQIVRMVSDSLTRPDTAVTFSYQGEAGRLPPEMATPLAVVLVELLQNSVEHAFGPEGGSIEVVTERDGDRLHLSVTDDGRGLPEGFGLDRAGLGLQIVRALVEDELGGKIELRSDGGTAVELELDVTARPGLRPPRG